MAYIVPPTGFEAIYGWKSQAFDPITVATSLTLTTSGVIYLTKLPWYSTDTITNIIVDVRTQGSTLTSGQCFAGIYTSAGTLVGTTADQSTAWASTGIKTMALSSGPYTVPGGGSSGFIYAAFLFNGTTGPSFLRSATTNASQINFSLTAGSLRAASISTGQTSLPASLTLANQTAHAVLYWTAVS